MYAFMHVSIIFSFLVSFSLVLFVFHTYKRLLLIVVDAEVIITFLDLFFPTDCFDFTLYLQPFITFCSPYMSC